MKAKGEKMSDTILKKNITHYLWEWASNYTDWAYLLVGKVIEKEISLSEEDRLMIYNEFLQSNTKIKNEFDVTKYKYNITSHKISLLSLSKIKNVNRLAEEQILNFSKNLTVIYGENGTGKTGYGRILKSLGICYSDKKEVLKNIYDDTEEKPSAKIEFLINDTKMDTEWNNDSCAIELSKLSIFDNSCVNISLGNERALLIKPIGFHLFSIVSQEIQKLNEINKSKIATLEIKRNILDDFTNSTYIYSKTKELLLKPDLDVFNSIKKFEAEDIEKLNTLKNEKKNLNKSLITFEMGECSKKIKELVGIIDTINKSINILSVDNINKFIEISKKINSLNMKKEKGISKIAEEKGIEYFDTPEFIDFIKSAETYIKKLNNENYPQEKGKCIYCQQEITDIESIQLIKNYRKALESKIDKEIEVEEKELKKIEDDFTKLNKLLVINNNSFGEDELQNPLQPEILSEFNQFVERVIQSVVEKNIKTLENFNEFEKKIEIETLFNQKKRELEEIKEKKQLDMSNIGEREVEIDKKIAELEDLKNFNDKRAEYSAIIINMIEKKRLETKSAELNTNLISRNTSEARKSLVEKHFESIFANEIKELRKGSIKLDLDFATKKADTMLKQVIKNINISEILSEGEQKAIALAEFLSELQLSDDKSPVVFDDPVNSLDHYIIDDVAGRLVKLSKERQVIIFTHSILLLNSIKQKEERDKTLEYKFYETHSDGKNVGYIYQGSDCGESYNRYRKIINEIFNLPKEERIMKEGELAKRGYANLRAAIEVFVEDSIFSKVIKRYKRNISLMNLGRVNGNLIEKHKEEINNIFERCCGYIEAHSNPDEVERNPSFTELEEDFKRIEEIKKAFD